MKPWEQNIGFCYIPDAKFPGSFCDLAGFGLRFLIKSCTVDALVFLQVLPRSVNRYFFMFQGETGSFLWHQTKLGGDSSDTGVVTPVSPMCASALEMSAVWSQRDVNSPSIVPILLKSYYFNGPKSSWLPCLLAGRARSNYSDIIPSPLPLFNMWLFIVQKKTCTHGLVEDVRLLERKQKICFSGYVAQLPWYPSVQNQHLLLKLVGAGLGF